jgi:hypothetical protein
MFGGLGVHDMERMSWALCIRWLWSLKVDPPSNHGMDFLSISQNKPKLYLVWLSQYLLVMGILPNNVFKSDDLLVVLADQLG